MKPRVVCIVQARMGSSRLPGKSLRVLAGRPLIDHVLERARAIVGVDEVALATTSLPLDDALADHLCGGPVQPFRGSEKDVLTRYMEVAAMCDADVVMRLTGDCPFLAPDVAHEVLKVYFDNPLESVYVSNDTTCSGYPDGTDVEVFSIKALELAYHSAKLPSDREHVTSWMRRTLTHAILKSDVDYSRYKLSVDTIGDYLYAVELAKALPPGDFTLGATMTAVQEM
jgi:spore coat polysaccharide biosynthesis protein SpsF